MEPAALIPPARPLDHASQLQCFGQLMLRDRPRRLVPLAAQDAANEQRQTRPGQKEWKGRAIHYSMT